MTLVEKRSVEPAAPRTDPVAVAVRLRPRQQQGIEQRFAPSDPPRSWDLARNPRVARLLRNRKFQFLLILPNQIIFWLVIFVGLLGSVVPGLNFGTAITWYVWFCLVFVMMVVVGRAWCVMCPFGGFGEWVQRRAFWKRAQHRLGLGKTLPEPVARYGFLLSVVSFLILTWIEEFFNIAGPGNPAATSLMVLGIVTSALTFFLLFDRRTFCRYICPLSAVIGTVGGIGSVAGFRTRDREVCLSCNTKDCMRGGDSGYGCPWYTWPGSADSNLACGLCSECYKSCPSDNIGLYVQKPLTSLVAPTRRRPDVAWAIAVLWGLVVFQQFNALNIYASIDSWLNRVMHFPQYPNPVDYLGIIALVALATAGLAKVIEVALARRDLALSSSGRTFLERWSRFRAFFLPLMYGIVPVVGADYFARQLPKFLIHAPRVVPAVGHLFGLASTSSALYHTSIATGSRVVAVQLVVMSIGTVAAMWTSWRISGRELAPIARRPLVARLSAVGLAVGFGTLACILYVAMHAAQ